MSVASNYFRGLKFFLVILSRMHIPCLENHNYIQQHKFNLCKSLLLQISVSKKKKKPKTIHVSSGCTHLFFCIFCVIISIFFTIAIIFSISVHLSFIVISNSFLIIILFFGFLLNLAVKNKLSDQIIKRNYQVHLMTFCSLHGFIPQRTDVFTP